MTWFAWAALMAPTLALASRLGVVNFGNGSTHPTKIPATLIAQAQAAARGRGRVILLRGGASLVGSRSYNFVLSGERTAARPRGRGSPNCETGLTPESGAGKGKPD